MNSTSELPTEAKPPAKAGLRHSLLVLVRAVRPYQWVKNLACFAGLIFSGRLFWADMQLRALVAFAAFSAAASATYLFNDYLDRHRDRLNPRTANRPFASGQLSVGLGAAAWVVLVLAALTGSVLLGWAGSGTHYRWSCLAVLIGYLGLNIGYTVRLKKTVIADVICISLGFVLRVVFGVYAVQVSPTPWIVLCMFFLALFLGFGKRQGELEAPQTDAAGARPVLSKYTVNYLHLVIGVTATLTIITYTLYCVDPKSNQDPTMVVTVLPVVYCVLRYAHQVLFEGRGQSPERLLFADKMLWIAITCWLVLSVVVRYGKPGLIAFVGPG